MSSGTRWPTLGFLGWFGPRGLASIVFAAIVVEETDLRTQSMMVSTTLVAVALSVLAHGVSASPLVRRYVAWYESHPRERARHGERHGRRPPLAPSRSA